MVIRTKMSMILAFSWVISTTAYARYWPLLVELDEDFTCKANSHPVMRLAHNEHEGSVKLIKGSEVAYDIECSRETNDKASSIVFSNFSVSIQGKQILTLGSARFEVKGSKEVDAAIVAHAPFEVDPLSDLAYFKALLESYQKYESEALVKLDISLRNMMERYIRDSSPDGMISGFLTILGLYFGPKVERLDTQWSDSSRQLWQIWDNMASSLGYPKRSGYDVYDPRELQGCWEQTILLGNLSIAISSVPQSTFPSGLYSESNQRRVSSLRAISNDLTLFTVPLSQHCVYQDMALRNNEQKAVAACAVLRELNRPEVHANPYSRMVLDALKPLAPDCN